MHVPLRVEEPDALVAVEWDDPDRGTGRGSVVIKITHSTVEGIVQSDMGYCLTTIT